MNNNDDVYGILDEFMTEYDFYPHDVPNHKGYRCDRLGNVYRPDNSRITPFNSLGYKQVSMKTDDGDKSIKGVHQVVAMTFDEAYYQGCVVHHIDENKTHNTWDNLKVESLSEHSRHHANPDAMLNWMKENGGPANKGKKMSDEFREHCREGALRRAERERVEGISHVNPGRYANQFVDADGNKKEMDPVKYEEFCEKCRIAALNRNKK